MVFGWLFGERKRQEPEAADVGALLAKAEEATWAKDAMRGESLCRELIKLSPDNADAWNMLGVNLIRRGIDVPEVRADAVIAWMRALALRPGDSRAADHLQAELQFSEELVPELIGRLSDPPPVCEDAAGALAQIGAKARPAVTKAAEGSGAVAERARAVLSNLA